VSEEEPVTQWLARLQAGDRAVAQQLWEAYFHRLVGLARLKLQGQPRRAADEEDVALSAFHSFFRGVERGRFPQLADRDNLWRLLVVLTARKAHHLVRDQRRQKRGGAAVGAGGEDGLEAVAGPEPTPAFAAQVADECRRLLDALGDEELRRIALWKMEGDSNGEIAAKLGRAPATVERRLALIRRTWEKEGVP
jgi:DNA-directed RNA polymerase specialized sigma24 family protein